MVSAHPPGQHGAHFQGDPTGHVAFHAPATAPAAPAVAATGGGLAEQDILALIDEALGRFDFPTSISTFDIETVLNQPPVREPTFAGAGGQPVAAGLEAMISQFIMLMQATEQARKQREQQLVQQRFESELAFAQRGQQFQFADLFANLMRADPVTAANLQFGITGEPINPFGEFTRALAGGQVPLSFGGLPPSVQIPVGGSTVDLATSLTGGQLFSLGQNPAALSIIQGLQELGGIDILGQSQRALIPGGVLPSAPI